MKQFALGLLTVSSLALAPFAATAQDASGEQSEEEITERLLKQKTRGLSISTNQASTTDGSAKTTGDTGTTIAATPEIKAVPKDEEVFVNISFDFDSAALRPDQLPKLDTLCRALVAANIESVRVIGHTDASGSAAYNARLSLLRAEEVKRYFGSNCDFPADRLEAVGAGEELLRDPSDPNGDINRRVELQVIS